MKPPEMPTEPLAVRGRGPDFSVIPEGRERCRPVSDPVRVYPDRIHGAES
jgi:hypothetical protein